MTVTRWGICSAGKICGDFTSALKSLPENHEIVAVSARKLAGAQDFAKRFNIPTAYEGHKSLAANPDIDIVYIGSIHPFHYEHSMMMLRAGKHVLCEKPMGMNLKQVQEVINLAREKKLFFLEGFWSRFFPVYKKIKSEIKEASIGEVRFVEAGFGKPILHVDRIQKLELGGGALLDLGCYPIQFAVMAFGEMPHKIDVSGTKAPSGVDDTTVIVLHFSNNRVANLTTSCSLELANRAMIVGTKDSIQLPDRFWCPKVMISPSGEKEFALPENKSNPLTFEHSEGFQYQAQEVHACLQRGAIESDFMRHEESLWIMRIIEEVKKQMGIVYPADKE